MTPPTQDGMAKMIAELIAKDTPAASLTLLIRFTPEGKKALKHAAQLTGPDVLLQPFKDDPKSWQWLQQFPDEKINKFAADFIAEARKLFPQETGAKQ